MTDRATASVTRGQMWRIAGWGTALALLLLPLIAMQFTSEVAWTGSDFLFAIFLFGSVGLGIELAVRTNNRAFVVASAAALLASFLQIWIPGAVGIIGSEREASNLLFPGVVLIALSGSALALFRPRGMAIAMLAAAVAQLAVPPVATVIGDSSRSAIWAPEVIILTFVFTVLWLVAARMYRLAAGSSA